MTPEERAERAYGPVAGLAEWQRADKARAVSRIAAAIGEAVAEEREACALIADSQDSAACEYIAEQIRARGSAPNEPASPAR